MEVKIDTKEKFTVLTPMLPQLNDNLTAELVALAKNCLQSVPNNVIVNMQLVTTVAAEAAEMLIQLQQHFYEVHASLVFCGIAKEVENSLDDAELLELLNYTPTESEAWDIVQMEEIERELMDDANPSFNDFEEEK